MKDSEETELRRCVALMRELGVTKWADITLGPAPEVVKPVDIPERVKKIVKAGKPGRDGLSYEQQIAEYGAAVDAEPDTYEE